MPIEFSKLVEKLQRAAEDVDSKKGAKDQGKALIVLTGLNADSKEALLDRALVIESFPFTIGRFSPQQPFASMKPDLVISDSRAMPLSEKHLTLVRKQGRIILGDANTPTGSLVNDHLIGKNVGGKGKVGLREGTYKLTLGGRGSPFVFRLQVKAGNGVVPLDSCTGFGKSPVPVGAPYIRLCHYTQHMLTSWRYDVRDRIYGVLEIVGSLPREGDAIERLYSYSAHPKTFSDVIVAHSVNTAIYVLKLLKTLGAGKKDAMVIGSSALLHDIGLYEVPNEILYKRTFTPTEYKLLKKHPVVSHDMLSRSDDDHKIIPAIALTHHERADGSGYPRGLKGVSEIAEFVAMADFFEALTHVRPQRGLMTPHQGVKMLLELKKGKFSPGALKAFVDGFSLFPVGSVVQLSSGEVGCIVKTHIQYPLRPVVRILVDRAGRSVEGGREIDLLEDNLRAITKDISDQLTKDPPSVNTLAPDFDLH